MHFHSASERSVGYLFLMRARVAKYPPRTTFHTASPHFHVLRRIGTISRPNNCHKASDPADAPDCPYQINRHGRSSCSQRRTRTLLTRMRTAKVMARPRWPVVYKAATAEPKTITFTPSPTSGTDTGARGAAKTPQRIAAKSGAPIPSAVLVSRLPPTHTPQ